jgi:hypothetical protein
MERTATNGVSTDNWSQPKQGSKYRKSLKLFRLVSQVTEHKHLAATATASLLACSLMTQEQWHRTLPDPTREDQPQDGYAHSPTIAQGTPSCEGAKVKRTLFSDLATLCQDAPTCASSVDSVLGLTKVTPAGALALDHPSALNTSNYPDTLHN